MGIGDWAQSPIPNSQSPIQILLLNNLIKIINYLINNYYLIKYKINKWNL